MSRKHRRSGRRRRKDVTIRIDLREVPSSPLLLGLYDRMVFMTHPDLRDDGPNKEPAT